VRRILEAHGGSVTARSEGRGKGSEFTVYLPALTTAEIAAPTRALAGDRAAPSSSRRVIMADDNRDAADTTAMMLARIATVLSENPAWVCVMGGVNDITSDVIATSTTIANLTAIFDAVLAANARLIACVILPTTSFGTAQRKADVDTDNTAIRAYAASHSPVVLCDWWASWSDPNVNGGYSPFAGYTSDGKHPSATGASVMGAYLAGVTNAVKPGTAGV